MTLYITFNVIVFVLLLASAISYVHYLHASHVSVLSGHTDTYERIHSRLKFSHHAMIILFWIAVISVGYHWFRDWGTIMQDLNF